MTTQEQTPNITLTDFEANRLTFQANGRTYIYDSRGYKFAHCPKTGDILTEPKESHLSGFDVGILFRAYDDSADKFFSFFTADCFDPAMHLICADSFEVAYDIFLSEFADEVDTTESDYDSEEKIEDAIANGEISYADGMKGLVHSESVNGFELKLIKAEFNS